MHMRSTSVKQSDPRYMENNIAPRILDAASRRHRNVQIIGAGHRQPVTFFSTTRNVLIESIRGVLKDEKVLFAVW